MQANNQTELIYTFKAEIWLQMHPYIGSHSFEKLSRLRNRPHIKVKTFTINTTVDWEISLLKNFREWPHPRKLNTRKFLQRIIMYTVLFLRVRIVHAAASRLTLDPRRLLLDLCYSIICSSLAVVYHEASR